MKESLKTYAQYAVVSAITCFMSSIPALTATLRPIALGSSKYFPTEHKCPVGGATGTLESQQSSRERARVLLRWEYESGSLVAFKFFAAVADGAFEQKVDWVPGAAMTDRERSIFEKSKLQGDYLLKEICLKGSQARREFQSIVRTNKDILDGRLAED